MYETVFHSCGVLVAGGGAAAIRAAIASASSGADTLLVTRGGLFREGSSFYERSPEWGIQYCEAKDVQAFAKQALDAADGCVDPRLIDIMAENSLDRLRDLESYGMRFVTLDELSIEPCFGKRRFGAMLRDLAECCRAFARQIAMNDLISFAEGVALSSLIIKDSRVGGAAGFDREGRLHVFSASAVVLATGGAQNLYKYAFRNGVNNGSAYAMAADVGARLVNLEFVQFICAATAPVKGLNYYQFAYVTNPKITDTTGAALLKDYLPAGLSEEKVVKTRAEHGPYNALDDSRYFDLAIVERSRHTPSPGAVITTDPEKLKTARYEPWRRTLSRYGLTTSDPITVYPACHAFNGGALIDQNAASDVAGLFACGESAGGCHGANRIGGNSMLATQVFGEIAGRNAALFSAQGQAEATQKDAENAIERDWRGFSGSEPPGVVMKEIQETMQARAFLERDEEGLKKGLADIERLRSSFDPAKYLGSKAVREASDAAHALKSAKLILSMMLARGETRGGHRRTDHPAKSPEGAAMLLSRAEGRDITVGRLQHA